MKNILVLGAGQSAPYLIRYLLDEAQAGGWFVTVADRDHAQASGRVGGHPHGSAVPLDASDDAMLASQIRQADVVVCFLAPRFQHQVAAACVEHGKHMVSASYCDRRIGELNAEAQRRGVLLLTETGLDPGIDHMSAMKVIDAIRARGGQITSFASYGSGVADPNTASNPLKYVITWNPRNVVMAAQKGAQYLIDGAIKVVPYPQVFARTWPVDVPGVGVMEGYPNRDSLSYLDTYGLKQARTMIRGTLRFPGFSETWQQIVRLGLPNDTLPIPNLAKRTWAECVEMFIPRTTAGLSLPERVALHLGISPTGAIMDRLCWLGLFSDAPIGHDGETMADALVHLLKQKLALPPGARDLVILQHEFEVAYPDEGGRREKHFSTLIAYGDPDGFTAMSKTVGLPAALAVKLVLNGQFGRDSGRALVGAHIPTLPSIYTPILAELEEAGLTFTDRVEPL